jgi:hypothetical protein
MPLMSSGRRRHWATLKEEIEVEDDMGGRTQSFEEYATAKVAIENQVAAGAEGTAVVSYRVTMPYRSDTVDKHLAGTQQQVVTAGKTLKVLEMASPEERNRELVLHCARV